jgi:hypothetical protein
MSVDYSVDQTKLISDVCVRCPGGLVNPRISSEHKSRGCKIVHVTDRTRARIHICVCMYSQLLLLQQQQVCAYMTRDCSHAFVQQAQQQQILTFLKGV